MDTIATADSVTAAIPYQSRKGKRRGRDYHSRIAHQQPDNGALPPPERLQMATIGISSTVDLVRYQQCRKGLVDITTPYPPEQNGEAPEQGWTAITGTVTGGV
ncbi:TPA: hypothetical protein MPK85_002236 [Salmonella enterica]|nr:hypothetical protein [Salmonella enterica]